MLLQPDPEASCIEDGWHLPLILQGKQIRSAAHQYRHAGGDCQIQKHLILVIATTGF
jgi:hypothetical protein